MADLIIMSSWIGRFANMISVRDNMAEIAIWFSLPRNKNNEINLSDVIYSKYKCYRKLHAFSYIWFVANVFFSRDANLNERRVNKTG